jgi:hypothetical protein
VKEGGIGGINRGREATGRRDISGGGEHGKGRTEDRKEENG